MKTHPHLLLRDALAALFVRAARGDDEALAAVGELEGWTGNGSVGAQLTALRAEDGAALFDAGRLAERFEPLAGYVRDRARRFAAACQWIQEERSSDDALECARAAWDAGLFFEVHELVEPVWLDDRTDRRPALQGIIMAGAALHHLVEGNLAGAGSLLGDAARHLESAPRDDRFDLEAFAKGLAEIGERVKAREISTIEDLGTLPRIERRTERHGE
ncbi:MAG: DUF309 domain-containing protein [Deltaproteobacteria bacterium]|nr:DUF309 domain-containing protein [Deltaproteobacteria bacterium]